jgi:hypothetical protein
MFLLLLVFLFSSQTKNRCFSASNFFAVLNLFLFFSHIYVFSSFFQSLLCRRDRRLPSNFSNALFSSQHHFSGVLVLANQLFLYLRSSIIDVTA